MSPLSTGTSEGQECFPLVEDLARHLDGAALDAAVLRAQQLLAEVYPRLLAQAIHAPGPTAEASSPLTTDSASAVEPVEPAASKPAVGTILHEDLDGDAWPGRDFGIREERAGRAVPDLSDGGPQIGLRVQRAAHRPVKPPMAFLDAPSSIADQAGSSAEGVAPGEYGDVALTPLPSLTPSSLRRISGNKLITDWLKVSTMPRTRRSAAFRQIDEAVHNLSSDPSRETLLLARTAISNWKESKVDGSARWEIVEDLRQFIQDEIDENSITAPMSRGSLSRDQRRRAAPWESDSPQRWWVASAYDMDTSILQRYLRTVPSAAREVPNISLLLHAKAEAPIPSVRFASGEVGHGWVEFVLPGGEREALGFWPAAEALGENVSALTVIKGTAGAVIKDWSMPRQTIATKISAADMERSLDYIRDHIHNRYVLAGPSAYNCVTFARGVYHAATGRRFPGWADVPNVLADAIAKSNRRGFERDQVQSSSGQDDGGGSRRALITQNLVTTSSSGPHDLAEETVSDNPFMRGTAEGNLLEDVDSTLRGDLAGSTFGVDTDRDRGAPVVDDAGTTEFAAQNDSFASVQDQLNPGPRRYQWKPVVPFAEETVAIATGRPGVGLPLEVIRYPARFVAQEIAGMDRDVAETLQATADSPTLEAAVTTATRRAAEAIRQKIAHTPGWGMENIDILVTTPAEGLVVWMMIAQRLANTLDHRVRISIGSEKGEPIEICPQ